MREQDFCFQFPASSVTVTCPIIGGFSHARRSGQCISWSHYRCRPLFEQSTFLALCTKSSSLPLPLVGVAQRTFRQFFSFTADFILFSVPFFFACSAPIVFEVLEEEIHFFTTIGVCDILSLCGKKNDRICSSMNQPTPLHMHPFASGETTDASFVYCFGMI